LAGLFLADPQRSLPAFSLEDAVSQLLQTLADVAPNHGFVLDHEHGLPTGILERRAMHGRNFRHPSRYREVQLKSGAMSGFAVDPDVAAALFNDAVHDGKSQPCALANFFGGEERVEDPGQN